MQLTLPDPFIFPKDTDIRSHLDDIRTIGKDAATYAEQNKNTELDYYNIMCAPKLGPIP